MHVYANVFVRDPLLFRAIFVSHCHLRFRTGQDHRLDIIPPDPESSFRGGLVEPVCPLRSWPLPGVCCDGSFSGILRLRY